MATYLELYTLHSDETLRHRVAVAVTIKAQALLALASPTTAQVTWATAALSNPLSKTDQLFRYVLAANNTATVAQITGATDSGIQTQVGAAVDKIIAGGV